MLPSRVVYSPATRSICFALSVVSSGSRSVRPAASASIQRSMLRMAEPPRALLVKMAQAMFFSGIVVLRVMKPLVPPPWPMICAPSTL